MCMEDNDIHAHMSKEGSTMSHQNFNLLAITKLITIGQSACHWLARGKCSAPVMLLSIAIFEFCTNQWQTQYQTDLLHI